MLAVDKRIPKYILDKILERENKCYGIACYTRYYQYLEYQSEKEISISTVAAKHSKLRKQALYIKKVAVHIPNKNICYVRDFDYTGMNGYVTSFSKEEDLDNKKSKRKTFVNCYLDEKWYACKYDYFQKDAEFINKDFIQKDERIKYCAYDGSVYLTEYLKHYFRNPKIEMVSKNLSSWLATKTNFVKKLQKDKKFLEFVKQNRETVIAFEKLSQVIIKAFIKGMTIERAFSIHQDTVFLHSRITDKAAFKFIVKNELVEKVVRYLRQKNLSVYSFGDYLKACIELNIDLKNTKNMFPEDFRTWHDIRINQYAALKAERDEECKKKMIEEIKGVAKKFISLTDYTDGVYICVMADSKEALVAEGKALSHCVGGMDYDQRIAKEESLILFVRKKEDVSTPFVTMEFSIKNSNVRQLYGYKDSRPDKSVEEFIYKKWLPIAEAKMKEISKKVRKAA